VDQTQAQAARAEVEAYVTPELLDREVNRRHCSFLSAILGEDLGHIRSHATRTLLPIHDLWVPRINECTRGVPEVDECGLAEIGNSKEETRGTQFRQVRAARCVIPYVLYAA
jgi:hypothetical protein